MHGFTKDRQHRQKDFKRSRGQATRLHRPDGQGSRHTIDKMEKKEDTSVTGPVKDVRYRQEELQDDRV